MYLIESSVNERLRQSSFFLVDGDTAVAYALIMVDLHGDVIDLLGIETRPENRGQGYSKKILKELCEHFGVEAIPHTGGFTDDGYERIRKYLKLAPGARTQYVCIAKEVFVSDWYRMESYWG